MYRRPGGASIELEGAKSISISKLDKCVIGPGDDIVAMINQGLDQADAGLIVFSTHARESRWVEAEASYLTYARKPVDG